MALGKEAIVREALRLLRREGLDALTFRKLMARLKVAAPAIYWRFDSKRDLLDAVAEAILQQEFSALVPCAGGDGSWEEWLAETLHRLRRAMLAYPDGARIVAGARPHQAPTLTRIAEYLLRAVEQGGVDLQTAGAVVFTALHYTFGHVIEEQSSPSLDKLAGPEASSIVAAYPAIARLIDASRKVPHSPEAIYDVGLRLIIAGAGASAGQRPVRRPRIRKRSRT
jgi:TetR/AcrR family tetracycline transcriptional repressor